jgi:hypothetical protein
MELIYMTDKEIMQQALHALETKGEHHPRVYEAVFALQARLGQTEDEPMEFVSHHLIGGNPDAEDGSWATQVEAFEAFALQFKNISHLAKHKYLFVRTPPKLEEVFQFDSDQPKYRMIGRFSVAEPKENT